MPLLGTVAQTVLGGITVLTGLNPLIVGSHLLLSLVIVALVTMLVRRAGEPGDEPVVVVVRPEIRVGRARARRRHGRRARRRHAGHRERPARGRRAHATGSGLDPQTVAWLHADLVAARDRAADRAARRPARRRGAARGRPRRDGDAPAHASSRRVLVGYLQFFTGRPWVLVAVHVLLGAVIWWATVRLLLRPHARASASPPRPA